MINQSKNMKRLYIILLLISSIQVVHGQDNLMQFNAGFEDADLAWSDVLDDFFWKRWGESTMHAGRSQTVVHQGDHSAAIDITSTAGVDVAGMAGLRREVTGLAKNSAYLLSFYIFAEGSGVQEVLVSVSDFTTDPVIPIANETLYYEGGAWTKLEFEFDTEAEGSDFSQIRFDIDFRAKVGKYYVDDFVLEKVQNKTPQEITFDELATYRVGDPDFELAAIASSGLPVNYSIDDESVAVINGSTVSILKDGLAQITASQPGNDEFEPAESIVRDLRITDPNKRSQTITFEPISDKVYGDENFVLSAVASSELPVEFSLLDGNVHLIENQVSITGTGQVSIVASQPGNDMYNAAPAITRTFNISKADQVINIEPIDDVYETARPIDVQASTSSGLELTYQLSGPATLAGDRIVVNDVGNVVLTVSQSGNENYNPAEATVAFEVLSCEAQDAQCSDGIIYVAKNGDDNNDGTVDAPFLTIQHAVSYMRPGETCIIHEGEYHERIVPGVDNITIQAAEGEKVVLTGFVTLDDWRLHEGQIYVADLTFSLGSQNMVMFDKQLMNLARWPNKDNFDPFDLQAEVATGDNTYIANNQIPDQNWSAGGVVWFLGKSRWTSWRRKINTSASGQVGFAALPDSWDFAGSHSPSKGGEFILYNSLQALDAPGEWYIDEVHKKIYFWAPEGQNLEGENVLVREFGNLIDLSDRTGITIEGLQLFGGNLIIGNAVGCTFKNSEILYGNHTLGYEGSNQNHSFRSNQSSVSFASSSSNNVIDHCNIQWGAASGIILRGSNNTVSNCYIGNFDYLGSYDAPIRLEGTNRLVHNEIFNAGRDAINGGGKGSEIGFNDIHHANLINDDCGGIYLCCNEYDFTRIHHNWIHDITSRNNNFSSYKATGIYLDNTTRDVIVDHNVLWGLEWAGIQINWAGTNLMIYNNTIWSTDGNYSSAMGRWVNGYEFTNVPVINTLANDNELHYTEQRHNVIIQDGDPFDGFEHHNFMPKAGSNAIDAGEAITGYTDNYSGNAPDAGAYERGLDYWVPGPDWDLSGQTAIDCNGDEGGSAFIDRCGSCVGGNTGREEQEICETPLTLKKKAGTKIRLYPNPTRDVVYISNLSSMAKFIVHDINGVKLMDGLVNPSEANIDISALYNGVYVLAVIQESSVDARMLIIK